MAIQGNPNRWMLDHIDPWWHTYSDLPYINEPFNDAASLELWRSLGYTQTRFTGDMYDMRCAEPKWIDAFRSYFPWQHFSWSVYRMRPGSVLPKHSDTYERFVKIYNIIEDTDIHRAVIFLEDWQSGHYFEIDETPITGWRAGDTVIWKYDVPHIAANMGMTDRYTLQITGVPIENTFL
jgi:hypothetical protein